MPQLHWWSVNDVRAIADDHVDVSSDYRPHWSGEG
jgi:hypothetical protein